MFYFVYKTTNTLNKMYAIGSCCTERADMHPEYLGSATELKAQIAEYGKEVFTREILYLAKSEDEVRDLERSEISEHIDDPFCLNIRISGCGGHKGEEVYLCETRKQKCRDAATQQNAKLTKEQRAVKAKYASSFLSPEKRKASLEKAQQTIRADKKAHGAKIKAGWDKNDPDRKTKVSEQAKALWADLEFRKKKTALSRKVNQGMITVLDLDTGRSLRVHKDTYRATPTLVTHTSKLAIEYKTRKPPNA